jgi:hypothetical protein
MILDASESYCLGVEPDLELVSEFLADELKELSDSDSIGLALVRSGVAFKRDDFRADLQALGAVTEVLTESCVQCQ